ncbi:MAG: nucleotidyltransferase domain-containing protein [Candidatus Rokubacteria bacterium]|nr:nucleotidyltransferase domain-containing protein [Candidatus Rokubacteria bacterium]
MSWTSVRWSTSEERRARLEAELRRILAELPRLGATKPVLFGSLASGKVGHTSDLDLILVAPSDERFTRRLERFYRALNPSIALDLFVYTPEEFSVMAGSSAASAWHSSPGDIQVRGP